MKRRTAMLLSIALLLLCAAPASAQEGLETQETAFELVFDEDEVPAAVPPEEKEAPVFVSPYIYGGAVLLGIFMACAMGRPFRKKAGDRRTDS